MLDKDPPQFSEAGLVIVRLDQLRPGENTDT